jgi:AraC family transcriptional regulator
MPQENRLSQVLEQARTAEGIACELRWEPMGVLELPGVEDVLIGIHVGASSKLVCRRGGKQYSGMAVHGDIDIIPAHTPMRWEMHDHNDTTLLLSLPQTLLRTVADESELDSARMEIRDQFQIRDTELEAIIWAIKREMEMGSPSGRLYLDGLTLAVASRLVVRHSSVTKRMEERDEGLDGRTLKQVLSFIEDQLAEDLSLEKIAAIAAMSASHLQTLFRISMGVTVHQYVIQRRVERAKAMLMQDGLSMAEIALAAGFAHQSHMARHMRRALGMPPQALKRLLTEVATAH